MNSILPVYQPPVPLATSLDNPKAHLEVEVVPTESFSALVFKYSPLETSLWLPTAAGVNFRRRATPPLKAYKAQGKSRDPTILWVAWWKVCSKAVL